MDPIEDLREFFRAYVSFESGRSKLVINYDSQLVVFEIDANQLGVQYEGTFALLATRAIFEVVDSEYFYETVRLEEKVLSDFLPGPLAALIFDCFGSLKVVNKCTLDTE